MQLPNEITIFNRTYQVEFIGEVDDAGLEKTPATRYVGMAFFDEQKIQIRVSSHPQSQLHTFFHEMAHIALDKVDNDGVVSLENACNAFADLLYDMCHHFDIVYKE